MKTLNTKFTIGDKIMENMNITMNNLIGITGAQEEQIIGKLLYFSLSNVLVKREKIEQICKDLDLPETPSNRLSYIDAFKTATGNVIDSRSNRKGGRVVSRIYFRDNKKTTDKIYSRELVKETINESTNKYQKLANIFYDDERKQINFSINAFCDEYDVRGYCMKAVENFYNNIECLNARQLETITGGLLKRMDALDIDIHGRIYFVPKKSLTALDQLEDFIEAISKENLNKTFLTVNSMYVANDKKQREKMAMEFYNMARREIEEFTKRVENLINTGSKSESVINRYVLKLQKLEQKKKYYEKLLCQELGELNNSYDTMSLLIEELQIRANSNLKLIA